MRHISMFALAIALYNSTAATPSLAGAWTLPQGDGQVIVTLSHSAADERFSAIGEEGRATDFEKTELRAFMEYGLKDWLTLHAQPEWRHKSTGSAFGETVRGLGRLDFGARVRVWRNDVAVISVQGVARMPGTNDRLAPANGGDTDWELDGRLLYGKGYTVLGRHAFTDMQLGYRVRFGDPADEVRLDMTAGINVTPKILALVQSFNSMSVGQATGGFLSTRENKISASIVYRIDDDWSVQAGLQGTVSGQNTLKERGFTLGIWRSF